MRYWRTADRSKVDDFLVHHGVDGQKWGVKHGPPYPLDESTSTGRRLIKKEAKRVEQGKAYKEKRKAKYQKQIDKLEAKVHKNPEKENSKRNIKRKYRINQLRNQLKDIDKMSNDTLLYLRDLERAEEWSSITQSLGFSSGYSAGLNAGMSMVHADSKTIKEVLSTLNEEQQRAVMNLIYIILQ